MTDFATVEDMSERTQGHITATSHPFLASELAAATRAIRNFCGWHIAEVETITWKVRGDYWKRVWLPAMQIQSITAATVDGEVVDPGTIDFDPETGWTNLYARNWEITFSAGYADVPADVKSATLQIAARALGSPLGLQSEQAGGVSVRHTAVSSGVAGGIAVLPHERDALTPYRIGATP